jgi:hypothetical protein
LLEFDTEKITDVLEDYVFFMQNRGDIAVGTDLAAPELFFEMNRKIWHNKLVRKGIRRLNRKKGGELVEQLKHEEMKITPSGRESFDHPTGRHNDMGIAWDLSIHGCIQLGLKVDLPGDCIGT